MKEKIVAVLVVAVIATLVATITKADVFTWDTYSDPGAEELIIYRSYASLTCDDSFTIPTSATYYDIGSTTTSLAFYVMTAKGGGEESSFSNEIIAKYCNGTLCQANFTANPSTDSVMLSWEEVDSVPNYQIRYQVEGGSWQIVDNPTSNPTFINLAPGNYLFQIYAKDALGRLIENNNVYPTVQATVANTPPPSPPNYKVEAFGANGVAGWNQTLMIAFDEADSSIENYHVVVFTSSAEALSGSTSGAIGDTLVPFGSNYCQTFDTSSYPILFFTVSAVGYNGIEGDAYVGYKLIGNVTETDNDGTAYNLSAVDGDDYNVLRAYYYKPFAQRSSDYCSEPNLYDILPFTLQERMDYNLDGLVNGAEYNMFRAVYTHTGAGH